MVDIDQIRNVFKARDLSVIGTKNKYGITIPLIDRGDGLELIYQVRSTKLRRQPGEISFPGGRLEEGETFLEGAIRECMEELRIDRENIRLIGENDIMMTDYKALIHSYVVFIEGIDFESIDPNPHEVEKLFTVPLDYLLKNGPEIHDIELEVRDSDGFPYELIPNGEDYKWDTRKEDICFYEYDDYIIWGLTGKITKAFIDILKTR